MAFYLYVPQSIRRLALQAAQSILKAREGLSLTSVATRNHNYEKVGHQDAEKETRKFLERIHAGLDLQLAEVMWLVNGAKASAPGSKQLNRVAGLTERSMEYLRLFKWTVDDIENAASPARNTEQGKMIIRQVHELRKGIDALDEALSEMHETYQ